MKRKNVLLMINNGKFLDIVANYAAAQGWRITLPPDGSVPHGWTGDGALVSFTRHGDDITDYVGGLVRNSVPVVAMSSVFPTIRMPRVLVDFAGCGYLAARHLSERGYRKFAFCSAERTSGAEAAYGAFADELRRNGCGDKVEWLVLNEQIPLEREHDWKMVSKAIRGFLQGVKRPFGVYAFSDPSAISVLDTAIEMGLTVPNDIGVMGTEDCSVFCENQDIPLTSINTNHKQLAITACERLKAFMDGEPCKAEDVYVPTLGVFERASTGVPKVGNPTIEKAFKIMEEHLPEQIPLEKLSESLAISPSKLNRLFHDAGCATPAAELRMMRIRKAKTLLRTTDLTLCEVAQKTGFAHAAHFLNVFRDLAGEPPTSWRAKWR